MSTRRMLDMGVCGKIPADTLYELYLETQDGNLLTLYQTRTSRTLGSWVYDGAAVLAKYIEAYVIHDSNHNGTLKNQTVIELGAGTGVVGIMMGSYGAEVIITDLEPLVPLLTYNIEQNAQFLDGRVRADTLRWGDDLADDIPKECDFIILANCVYYEGSLEVLAQTTYELAGEKTVIYACYEERTAEIKTLITKWHSVIGEKFVIEDVPKEYYRNLGQLDCVRIVKMRKK